MCMHIETLRAHICMNGILCQHAGTSRNVKFASSRVKPYLQAEVFGPRYQPVQHAHETFNGMTFLSKVLLSSLQSFHLSMQVVPQHCCLSSSLLGLGATRALQLPRSAMHAIGVPTPGRPAGLRRSATACIVERCRRRPRRLIAGALCEL